MLKFVSRNVLSYDNETLDISKVFPGVDLQEMSKPYKIPPRTATHLKTRLTGCSQILVHKIMRGLTRAIQEAIETLGQEVLDITKCKYPPGHFRRGVWISGPDLGREAQRFVLQLTVLLFLNGNNKNDVSIDGDPPNVSDESGHQCYLNYTFLFRRLYEFNRLSLFDPQLMPLISRIRLRNSVMKKVLDILSLPYDKFELRHFGEIFEKILSYSGVITTEDTYQMFSEKKGKSAKTVGEEGYEEEQETVDVRHDKLAACRFIAVRRASTIPRRNLYSVNGYPVIFPRGTFLYRLNTTAQSDHGAFFTPLPLARTLVKHTLMERTKNESANGILNLTILEPAMGAGALLLETINQISDLYLERKQEELKQDLPQKDYFNECQNVRRVVASKNSFGVDLNARSVEIAKVCLWINSLPKGKTL